MHSSSSVKKEEISRKALKIGIAAAIVISIINTMFVILAEKNISIFLKKSKYAELVNVTATISNEILEANFRTVRNRLSLFKNTNTFDHFIIINEKGIVIEGQVPSDKGLIKMDIPVYYPNSRYVSSYVSYFYSDINYKHTKKIFLGYILIFLSTVILASFYFVRSFINYLNKTIHEYELKFEAISNDAFLDISNIDNPFSPTLYKLKEGLLRIKSQNEKINNFEQEKYKLNLAKKLAHDIRSPLSTLNLISSKIEDPEIRSLQQAVSEQIDAIANKLLRETKDSKNNYQLNSDSQKMTISLSDFFANFIKEYSLKASLITQNIMFEINFESIKLVNVDKELANIIYSSLNNFIQNSVEATQSNGSIKLIVDIDSVNIITIKVIDNGKGIPADVLEKLGHGELSYGKINLNSLDEKISGSGIAVFNAKQGLLKFGGELLIDSEVGVGTTVTLKIPLAD